MKKWTTTNGYEVYLFSTGFSNSYLVRFRGKSILTDTSLKAYYSKLEKEWKAKAKPKKAIPANPASFRRVSSENDNLIS